MRRFALPALIILAASAIPAAAFAGACSLTCAPLGANETRIVVTPFRSGSEQLGQAVASVLGLQVWQTLQIGPANEATGGNKTNGTVLFARQLPVNLFKSRGEFKEALHELRTSAQLILSGSAARYGDSVVVLPWLMLDSDMRVRAPELWTLRVGSVEVKAPPPSTFYEFEPIVLKPDLLERYSSPSGQTLYADPEGRQPMPGHSGAPATVGDTLTAYEQRPAAAFVETQTPAGREKGWIMLPQLGEVRSEVVEFVAGLVRVYRGDWNGAITMMNGVIENEHTPATIRVDAYLLKAMAASNLGRADADSLAMAEKLLPEKPSITMYETMADIARALNTDVQDRRGLLRITQKRLTDRRWTFAADDPWPAKALAAITLLQNNAAIAK